MRRQKTAAPYAWVRIAEKNKMTNERLGIIHKHWIWANTIKLLFDNEIKNPQNKDIKIENLIIRPYGTYMSLWYGLLFVVLEALKEENIIISEIQEDINDIYDSLRVYRNAVFHAQEKYWSPKFFEIMEKTNSVRKIWNVHKKVGDFLLKEIQNENGRNQNSNP